MDLSRGMLCGFSRVPKQFLSFSFFSFSLLFFFSFSFFLFFFSCLPASYSLSDPNPYTHFLSILFLLFSKLESWEIYFFILFILSFSRPSLLWEWWQPNGISTLIQTNNFGVADSALCCILRTKVCCCWPAAAVAGPSCLMMDASSAFFFILALLLLLLMLLLLVMRIRFNWNLIGTGSTSQWTATHCCEE